MTLSSFFLSFLPTHLDSSIDYLEFRPGWLQIVQHWIPPRLNFCSLVSVNNLPKSTTPRSTPLTLLGTSASYLINTSLFLTRSHLSPNHAITIFVSFAVSVFTSIPKQFPPSHFHCSPQAWLLQFSLSQPAKVSDHPAPTDPELSCTCCCQSSQIQSHHSHPPVSTLAKDNRAHWIQAHLTYLQSSHNHPTFISA